EEAAGVEIDHDDLDLFAEVGAVGQGETPAVDLDLVAAAGLAELRGEFLGLLGQLLVNGGDVGTGGLLDHGLGSCLLGAAACHVRCTSCRCDYAILRTLSLVRVMLPTPGIGLPPSCSIISRTALTAR